MSNNGEFTRSQLAGFLPDSRAIKSFETIVQAVNVELPAAIAQAKAVADAAKVAADNAVTIANAAADAVVILTQSLSDLAFRVSVIEAVPIKFNNAAPVFSSDITLTDFASTKAGSLTNAPAAGNPTKWISYNDHGITRYIPTW